MDYSAPKYPNNYYYKGPPNPRSTRNKNHNTTTTEYGYNNRRSTQSIHPLWQEGIPSKSSKSRGKLCSVVLAIASFFVVLAVLAIAGMALYMGVFHESEPTTNKNLLHFSCSAKISRGDRFIGKALQEKARRYRFQFETLYKRSVLGPSFVSCMVEQFGNDTFTIYFKLTLDRSKITHLSNVRKTIRDILITDAIARKPVFRTVRFDQKSIRVQQTNDLELQQNSMTPVKTKRTESIIGQTAPKKDGVIRGSFTISKTEADITRKKGDVTTRATTTKRPVTVTTGYKIGAIEKVNRSNTVVTPTTSTSTATAPSSDQPWVPIVSTTTQSHEKQQPIYTSFTNPGLSHHFLDKEALGSTNLRRHPIPVNKLPQVESSTVPLRREFIEIETLKYIPGSDKNASSIFQEVIHEDMNFGQGQAEVVDEAEESLIMQTTKLPLVTLLPVKSNSGIGRPLRKRPDGSYASDRSFPEEVVTSVSSDASGTKVNLSDFNVMSVLNFDKLDDGRNSKMDVHNDTDVIVAVYATNSSVSTNHNYNLLTPEKLVQLSEISNIHNDSNPEVIASNSHFQILTKTYHKIDAVKNLTLESLETECDNTTIQCGDGQCLPETARCNQLIDCNDGKDEKDCRCADYLRSQYLVRKICDGVVDCWDYSDENQCEWCKPNQYVCANSKVCIDKENICNGHKDCPQGDDEQQCVTIAEDLDSAGEIAYNSQGSLLVKKNGIWGKLCAENLFQNSLGSLELNNFGRFVCKSLSYESLADIQRVHDEDPAPRFYHQVKHTTVLSFEQTACATKEILRLKCKDLECGTRPHAVKHVARRYRIVGGGNASLGSWPWQAAMYKEGEFQCGATLISEMWLLSAGHCFYHSQDEFWVARLGALRRGTSLPSPYEQLKRITNIHVHPGYVDSGFINDISLLRMESRVHFSDFVRPICLPSDDLNDGQICTVVGWGQLFEVGRIFPDTLQEVQVPVISTEECRKKTDAILPLYKITDDMFCAGYERGGRDACLGDSGGPLMCPKANGKWVLQGITSNGYGCARANRPGVYTKVSNYLSWIYTQMKSTPNETFTSKSACHGHRCPLGECLPKSRTCNGFIECSDGSDENTC